MSPWPFAQWGIDIVGPLPTALAQKKLLLVAIDYFSKLSDNGPQFDSGEYRNFCHELKIKNLYSTPRYPQSNGQAEASNKTLLTALKKRLDSVEGKWVDELPDVLWAYKTIARKPTDISPFTLIYGMEAIVPTEIGMPTLRTDIPEQSNTESVIKDLDMVDELCKAAAVRIDRTTAG